MVSSPDTGASMPRSRRGPRDRFGRVRTLAAEAQWWVIGAVAATALVLGFVGFLSYQRATGGPAGVWDVLYLTLQLFTLESGALEVAAAIPPSLQIARLLAPAVATIAVVGAVVALAREQLERVRLRFARGHVVVCGLGEEGLALARSLRAHGYRVVAVERDRENDLVVSCRASGVPVLIGDATAVEVLRKVDIRRAAYVVALCGDSGVNANIAATVQTLVRDRRAPLTCLAHVLEPSLCRLLTARYLSSADDSPFRLEFFNLYERGAQVLLARHPPFDHEHPTDAAGPHLVVVGIGEFGRHLVLEAARRWRTHRSDARQRLRITIVDREALDRAELLQLHHPELADVWELTAARVADPGAAPRPVDLDVHDLAFETGAFLRSTPDTTTTDLVDAAYVCLDDDVMSLRAGLTLRRLLRGEPAPVVVRTRTGHGLAALTDSAVGGLDDVQAFALLDHTCDADLLLGGIYEALARMLHAEYVQAREAQGWTYGPERDDERRTNPALAPWPALAERFRESNRDQAAHTQLKLAAVGCQLVEFDDGDSTPFRFTDDEIEQLAELEHRRWMDFQTGQTSRWSRRRGEQHPDLIPYAQLTEQDREIDRAFVRSLPRLLTRLGYRLVRDVDEPSARSGGPAADAQSNP